MMTFKWLSYKTITKMKLIVRAKIKEKSLHPLSPRAFHNTVFFTSLYTYTFSMAQKFSHLPTTLVIFQIKGGSDVI